MLYHNTTTKSQNGFALLLALVVVSVIVSVGLTVLDLTIKQVRLSTNSKESEIAFHAANAAVECARYTRVLATTTMESGSNVSMSCFGAVAETVTPTTVIPGAYMYSPTGFTWGLSGAQRCSLMKILVIVSSSDATTTVPNMKTLMPGYPNNTKDCEPGGLCTVISAQGYSNTCGNIGTAGTVQREVLLEL